MATRTRSSGVTGLAVGLVIFVVLFVAALVAAIMLYTKWDGSQQELAKVQADENRLVTPIERQQPDIQPLLAGSGRPSVIRSLVDENRKLKALISPNDQASLDVILKDAQTAGVEEGKTFIGEISRLKAEVADARHRAELAQKAQADAEAKLAAIHQQIQAASGVYSAAQQKTDVQVQNLMTQGKDEAAQATAARTRLEGELKQAQDAAAAEVKAKSDQLDQLRQEVGILRAKIDQLTQRSGVRSVVDISRLPDGKIIDVSQDGQTVTINLGGKQHIVLGLTFDVYPAGTSLIQKDASGNLVPGKAIIEVDSVGEYTATARVISLDQGASVSTGDVIANVVYDPTATLRFYVYGPFDLDNTGSPSNADKKRVEGMITQWGGKLVQHLDYDTDFLVLGAPPVAPEPLRPEDANDPVKVEEHTRQEQVWKEYQRLLGEAQRYKITVLNQNRFLALVGYVHR